MEAGSSEVMRVGTSLVCPPFPKWYVSTTQLAHATKTVSLGDGSCLFIFILWAMMDGIWSNITNHILHAKKLSGLSVIFGWLTFKYFREITLSLPLQTHRK